MAQLRVFALCACSALTLIACEQQAAAPTVQDSAEYVKLLKLLPVELKPKPVNAESVARGERLLQILLKTEIPPPLARRSRPTLRDPELYTRPYHSPAAILELGRIIDEGPIEVDPNAHLKNGKMSPMLYPALFKSLLAESVSAGLRTDKKACAAWLGRSIRFYDWIATRSGDMAVANDAPFLEGALALAVRKQWLDRAGWKHLVECVPPAGEVDDESIERRKRRLVEELRRLADFQRQPREGHIFDSKFPMCGNLDRKATAKLMVETALRDIENYKRPFSRQRKSADQEAQKLLAKLPVEPDEHDYLGRPEADYRKAYDAYCVKMDALPNSLARNFTIGGPFIDQDSFVNRTLREMVRAFVALNGFQEAAGRLPGSWKELVQAGWLEQAPRDFFSAGPIGFDPVKRRIWTVGIDGRFQGSSGYLKAFLYPASSDSADLIWELPSPT